MKTILIIFASLIVLLLATTLVIAQPSLPGPPSQAPIDGGLGLLAAAGGAYAYKRLKKSNSME